MKGQPFSLQYRGPFLVGCPALRIAQALTVAAHLSWSGQLVYHFDRSYTSQHNHVYIRYCEINMKARV